MADIAEQRKEKVLTFLKKYQSWVVYLLLAVLVIIAFLNRIAPLPNIIDSTTGDYIPIEIDSFVFLRYAQEILVNGTQASVDSLRYYPDGYPNEGEFSLLATLIVYLYKFLHFFDSSATLAYADVLYPPLAFAISLIFFFLLIRRLTDYRVALLATAYLAFIPTYIQRSTAGFADKEALGMLFFFISLYFFAIAYLHSKSSTALLFGFLSGIFAALMGKTWGGIRFLFLIVGLYVFIEVLFNRLTREKLFAYGAWFLTTVPVLYFIYPSRYPLVNFLVTPTMGIISVAFFTALIYYALTHYHFFGFHKRLQEKYPLGILSFLVVVVLGIFSILTFYGFDYFPHLITDSFSFLTSPFVESRWGMTVAESHQPYMRDFVGQVGNLFFGLFLAGAVMLFYRFIQPLKEKKRLLTILFALFVLAFSLNRYSPSAPILNGTHPLALFLFFGSTILFFAFIVVGSLHIYRKRREHYLELLTLRGGFIFALVWFFVTIAGVRTMVRLVIMLSPTLAFFASYAFVTLYDYALQQRHRLYKIALLVGLLCLLFLPTFTGSLTSIYKQTSRITSNSGPIYTPQWQQAMQWVRENTPQNAVFVHWWDYGYWVQTGGERATVSDGGNNGGAGINYYTARYLLTAPDDRDVLAYMKARGADYALIVSEDIGKYPAFSSIGSDLTNDRYSWISAFSLDSKQIQETRNQTLYTYVGGASLDEDFIYNDHLFPQQGAGIAAFVVPYTDKNNNSVSLGRPTALLVHNNQRYDIPVNCVVAQGQRYVFGKDGLDSCLAIIPSFESNRVNPVGAILHLSRKVKDSFLARYYIYGLESPHFSLVYSNHESVPLALYNGRIIGPHKIWKANFPPDLVVDPTLASNALPDPRLYYVVK